MADLLDAVVGQMRERADVLRPAVAEYRDLTEALQRLGANDIAAPAAEPDDVPVQRTVGRPKGGGFWQERTLELVKEQPGLTAAQIAKELGMNSTYVFRVVSGLKQDGKIRRGRNKTWHPTRGNT